MLIFACQSTLAHVEIYLQSKQNVTQPQISVPIYPTIRPPLRVILPSYFQFTTSAMPVIPWHSGPADNIDGQKSQRQL